MGNIKDRWDSLNPNAKRGLTVFGIVASAMGAVWVIANFTPQPAPKADKQQTVKHILTDTDPRSLGKRQRPVKNDGSPTHSIFGKYQ